MPAVGFLIACTYSTQADDSTRSAAATSAGLPLPAWAAAAWTWAASCGPEAKPSNGARWRIAVSWATMAGSTPVLNQIGGTFHWS